MNFKKMLALLLTLCMIFSIMAPTAAAVQTNSASGVQQSENKVSGGSLADRLLTKGDTSGSNSLRDNQSGVINRENLSFENGKWIATVADGVSIDLTDAQLPEDIQALRIESQYYSAEDVVHAFITLEAVPTIELYSSIHDVPAQLTNSMLEKQDSLIAAIEQQVLGGSELAVVTQFTHLTNSIVVETQFGNLEAIAAMPGVKSVFLSPVYQALETTDVLYPATESSTVMTGVASVWQNLGYTGKGMTIAILDTGLDLDHPSFAADPASPLWNAEWLQEMLDTYDLRAEELYGGELTAEDLYYNAKVPFAFNYASSSLNVLHNDGVGDHGTHVAGIAAANALEGSGVVGMAPDAQIIAMKVFGPSGSASMYDVIEALQDCMVLGVDVVNLSLGSPAGFSDTDIEEIDNIFERIAESDMIVDIAAGNEATSSYGSTWGTYLQLTRHIENGTMASPATYANALAVGSVENNLVAANYLALADGTEIFYMDSVEVLYEYTSITLRDLMGRELEYVIIDGLGEKDDFYDADGNSIVKDKIAIIPRGTLTFGTKVQNAELAGAVAALIWNNVDEDIFSFGMTTSYDDGSYPSIPTALITLGDGEKMAAAEVKTILVPTDHSYREASSGGQISSFSSWGTTSDLRLLPDVSGVGGNVLSCYDNGEYGIMSGTSMATPQVAGVTALLLQYLKEKFPAANASEIRTLADSLLMSTAVPVIDSDSGVEASPRQQGAGLVNALGATTAEAYLSVANSARPKAELKDNANGEFSFTFTVHNFSNEERTYSLRSSLLAEDYIEYYPGYYFLAEQDKALDNSAVTFSSDTVTVAAGGTADVTVTIKLTDADKEWIDTYFPSGNYVEGFIYLESEDEVTLSLPFMGFYGQWDEAPLFDSGFWYDDGMWLGDDGYITANQFSHMLWTELAGNSWVLGLNPYMGAQYYYDDDGNPHVYYNPDNNVLSPNGDGVVDSFVQIYLSLMRNAEELEIVITDAEGEELDYRKFWKESKSMYISGYGQVVPFVYTWTYSDFYDFSDLEDGDVAYMSISGVIDYEGAEWDVLFDKMPIYIDTTAPVLDTTKIVESSDEDGNYITITIEETHPAAVITMNNSGTQLYDYYDDLVMSDNGDGTYTVTLDVTGLGDNFMIVLGDYGGNESYYNLTWSESGTNNPEMDETALYAYQVYDEYLYYYYGWDYMFGWTTIDKQTAEATMISSDMYEYYALTAAEYVDGYVFAVDAGGNFLYMTPGVWSRNVICNIGLNVVDMAFDDVSGTMYLATTDKENYSYCLYTIDLLTGELTQLWDYYSQYSMPWAMTFVDGTLYCTKYYYGGLYTVDVENYCELAPVTDADGNSVVIKGSNNSAVRPYYAQSMTYSAADGVIYWAYYNGYACDLVTINPTDWTNTAVPMAYDQEYVGVLTLEEKDYTLPESAEVTKMILSDEQVVIGTDQTHELSVTLLPWNAPVTEAVVWESDDEAVATVENGQIYGVSEGSAVITASYGDLSVECVVNVVNIEGHLNAYKYYDGNYDYGYWLDIDLKTVTEESTIESPVDFIAADYNGHTGLVYGFSEYGQCYWFNPATGEYGMLGTADTSKIPDDMAYDYSTGFMYAIVNDDSTFTTTLYVLNMNTGDLVEMATTYDYYVTLACSTEGQLYAINYYGELYELYLVEGEMGGGGIMLWSVDDGVDDDIGVGGGTTEVSYYIDPWFVMYVPVQQVYYAQTMCYDHNNDVLLWINPEASVVYWLDGLTSDAPFAVNLGDPSGTGLIQYTGAYVVPETVPELPFFPVTGASASDMVMLVGQEKPANISVQPLNASGYTVLYAGTQDASIAYYDEETGKVVAAGVGTTMMGLYVVDLGEDGELDLNADAVYQVYFNVTVKKPTDNIVGYMMQDLANGDGYYWINIPDTNPANYQGLSYVYWQGAYMTLYAAEYFNGTIYAYGYDDSDWNANFQFLTIDAKTFAVTSATDMGDGFPFVYDMAFDYTTGTMYALAGPSSNTTDLYYVNLANGQLIECMSTGAEYMFMSLTVDADGTMYAMAASVEEMDWDTWSSVLLNAQMYTLDPEAGTIEWFMDSGVTSNMLTSMAYDHDTGYIYWHALNGSRESGVYLIDLEEKASYSLGTIGNAGAQLTGLMVLADNYPEVPSTLKNVNLTSSMEELAIGGSVTLELFLQPATVEVSLTWETSDETVATVDENGVVTAVGAGTATITVTATDGEQNSKSDTCEIRVYSDDDYFITYNRTTGGFSKISRPDSTIVSSITEGEDYAPVTAMTMVNGIIFGYDEENNLFYTSEHRDYERVYIGNAGIEVDEPYETQTNYGSYGYDRYFTPAFEIRDMAYDAANDRMLVLGCYVEDYVVYYWYESETYSTRYVYDSGKAELNYGCSIYSVDMNTGAISELCVVGGEDYESGVSMFTVDNDGQAYIYGYYMDYVMKMDLETGVVTYMTTFQNQGVYGSDNGDPMAMVYDEGTDALYMLFTQNGKYYQLYKFNLTTQMITLVDYVGDVVYANYSYTADLFAGLALNSEHVCKFDDASLGEDGSLVYECLCGETKTEELTVRESALVEAIAALEEAIAAGDQELSDEIAAVNAALQEVVAAYQAADASLRSELSNQIASANASMQALVSQLSSDLAAAEKELAAAIAAGDKALDDKIAALNTALENAIAVSGAAEDAIQAEIDAAVAALEAAIAAGDKALEDKIAALEAANEALKNELNQAITDAVATLNAAIAQVQKNLDAAKAELNAKDDQLAAKDDELAAKDDQLAAQAAQLSKLVTVAIVIASIAACGCVALLVLNIIDKRKKA